MACCTFSKYLTVFAVGLVAGVAVLPRISGVPAGAQVGQDEGRGGQPEGGGQMDPEQIMEEYAKLNQPGEHHKLLQPLVGTFNAKMTAEVPGGEPMEFTGVMTNSWVMDGKFLKQDYKGKIFEDTFSGLGYTGYSTVDKKYQGIWFDSMSTTMYYAEGSVSDDGKTFTTTGKETDPMTGQTAEYKDVTVVTDNDHHTMTRYYITPDGDIQGFAIEYTRRP